jgi:hypothetical protein
MPALLDHRGFEPLLIIAFTVNWLPTELVALKLCLQCAAALSEANSDCGALFACDAASARAKPFPLSGVPGTHSEASGSLNIEAAA